MARSRLTLLWIGVVAAAVIYVLYAWAMAPILQDELGLHRHWPRDQAVLLLICRPVFAAGVALLAIAYLAWGTVARKAWVVVGTVCCLLGLVMGQVVERAVRDLPVLATPAQVHQAAREKYRTTPPAGRSSRATAAEEDRAGPAGGSR